MEQESPHISFNDNDRGIDRITSKIIFFQLMNDKNTDRQSESCFKHDKTAVKCA